MHASRNTCLCEERDALARPMEAPTQLWAVGTNWELATDLCVEWFLLKAFAEDSEHGQRLCLQVVSLHCNLDKDTHHLINKERLSKMKDEAVLVNAARGPCIDESALVEHLKANPKFFVGLDVFEDEPAMKPGLAECSNAVIVPHIASASMWTRSGMATLAACNVAARIAGNPVWSSQDVLPFVNGDFDLIPKASPSIVNAKELNLPSA